MSVRIFYDNTRYRFRNWRKAKVLLGQIIRSENMISGDLYFIITDDENLKRINIEFLNHNYYTDVITFSYKDNNIINGEIYISIDTVKANAHNYKVSLLNEMLRVMIHGVLHLTGYNDRTDIERSRMRSMEDKWLDEWRVINYGCGI